MSAQILSAGSSASGASMAPAPDVPAELDTNYAAAICTGLWLLILGFGGFLAWVVAPVLLVK